MATVTRHELDLVLQALRHATRQDYGRSEENPRPVEASDVARLIHRHDLHPELDLAGIVHLTEGRGRYGFSHTKVKRRLDRLVEDGLVVRISGRANGMSRSDSIGYLLKVDAARFEEARNQRKAAAELAQQHKDAIREDGRIEVTGRNGVIVNPTELLEALDLLDELAEYITETHERGCLACHERTVGAEWDDIADRLEERRRRIEARRTT